MTRSFPPAAAKQLEDRDLWCVFCGSPFNLHHHHRRLKGIGGDPRPHEHCACDGVMLCATHHAWIHDTAEGRRVAREEGLIISRSVTEPWTVSVLVHLEDDRGGMTKYPSCDSGWLDEPQRGAA